MQKGFFTVGELAKKMNVSVRTLQYYDREGLLAPSGRSEGGRRLYSQKDLVRLHQILSLKYLGFSLGEIKSLSVSLDTPQQVAALLEKQGAAVKREISNLQKAAKAIDALHKEVIQMDRVDFEKYSDIITMLRMDNQYYWVWKALSDPLVAHVKERFSENPELGIRVIETYHDISKEAACLQETGIAPQSAEGVQLGKRWWEMILDFTGGDMSLLPALMEFNSNREKWDADFEQKQKRIEGYMEKALVRYFEENGIRIPELEGKNE